MLQLHLIFHNHGSLLVFCFMLILDSYCFPLIDGNFFVNQELDNFLFFICFAHLIYMIFFLSQELDISSSFYFLFLYLLVFFPFFSFNSLLSLLVFLLLPLLKFDLSSSSYYQFQFLMALSHLRVDDDFHLTLFFGLAVLTPGH